MFHLSRGATQCFTMNAKAHSKLHGEIRVALGKGQMDVGYFLLVGVTNDMLSGKSDIEHETFSVVAPAGPHHGHDEHSTPAEYKLCVYNRAPFNSARDYRVVYVTFGSEAGADEFEDERGPLEGLATGSNVKQIENTIRHIQSTIDAVMDEIDSIRIREGDMFAITDSMAFQMTLMGIIACSAILLAGLLQVIQTKTELVKHASRLLDASNQVPREGSKKLRRQGSFVMPSAPKISRLASLASKQVLPQHGSAQAAPKKS
ncbi:emp24/gp25L/p24/GOLD [Gracilaria domingensis]|nr:emp24/gp25L/p24/GOLD [Gracilaria domingensis]